MRPWDLVGRGPPSLLTTCSSCSSSGPCCDVDIPRRRGRGRARAAREDNERAPLRSPVSLLPAAGLRSPSSTPPASGPPPPRRRSPVPLLPAASRPAAHLPDGQLLVCSPPRAGGWAPAPAGGSPVRWAACRLTPAPADSRLDVTSPAQLASSVLIVLLVC
ncbi:hypothetical protein PVAP13_8KG118390 [Panicum virgatum]|uniref:Uncharacterized protein n=1 Tax=Panicum virgatum TaxID=38727 RepID=A0A8T0PKZ5_PANVG|nr:hypothetical protein PVAP13_8KG118390 [Panicum virgatum]